MSAVQKHLLLALVGLTLGGLCGMVGATEEPSRPRDRQERGADERSSPSAELRGARVAEREDAREQRVQEVHAAQRLTFLSQWGRPPLPASSRQPTEEELWEFLRELGEHEVLEVDCFVYPCVAILFDSELDEALEDVVKERYPHAIVRADRMGTDRGEERITAWTLSLAFLDSPVTIPGAESMFVHRLMQAVGHRTAQERFERLHAAWED